MNEYWSLCFIRNLEMWFAWNIDIRWYDTGIEWRSFVLTQWMNNVTSSIIDIRWYSPHRTSGRHYTKSKEEKCDRQVLLEKLNKIKKLRLCHVEYLMLNKVLPRHQHFIFYFIFSFCHTLYVNKLPKFKWRHRYRLLRKEGRSVGRTVL